MNQIFRARNYRKLIECAMQRRRSKQIDYSFQALAEATRIPKSTLSKVMHETADLCLDQLHLIARELKLSEEEHEYAELLLEWERSGIADRKRKLKTQIDAIRERHLDAAKELTAAHSPESAPDWERYHVSPWAQIVHMALMIPANAQAPKRLASALGLPENLLQEAIYVLEKSGVIERRGEAFRVIRQSLHLPRGSLLSQVRTTQQMHMSIDQMQRVPADEKYSFGVFFCSSDETRREIQDRFLGFLKEVEALVAAAPSERVFQMTFSLLPWTFSR